MPSWPEKRQLIGTDVPRIDGLKKVSGQAKYSHDINLPGLLHGRILRSPHAHARFRSIDVSGAEKMPGVKAIHEIKKAGDELNYVGDEIVAVAAVSLDVAGDAVAAIDVKYAVLPHVASEADAQATGGDDRALDL